MISGIFLNEGVLGSLGSYNAKTSQGLPTWKALQARGLWTEPWTFPQAISRKQS